MSWVSRFINPVSEVDKILDALQTAAEERLHLEHMILCHSDGSSHINECDVLPTVEGVFLYDYFMEGIE